MRVNPKSGFTLVELLVVITIIGILIALLLPAVQAAREAARRTQCANNLKQLALALHGYHEKHGTFPPGALTTTTDYHQGHSWIAMLLPHIEQQAVYDKLDFSKLPNQAPNPSVLLDLVIPGLVCPSDTEGGLLSNARLPTGYLAGSAGTFSLGQSYTPCAGPLEYAGCTVAPMSPNINCINTDPSGGNFGGGRYDQGSPGMFAGGYTCYSTAACRDGTSNTLLLGEQLPVYCVHMMYFHSHLNCATTNVPPNYWLINPRGCPPAPVGEVIPYCFRDMSGYNSMHRGGVNVALADGSVRFVGDTVDYVTSQYLGNKNDGKPVDASKF